MRSSVNRFIETMRKDRKMSGKTKDVKRETYKTPALKVARIKRSPNRRQGKVKKHKMK